MKKRIISINVNTASFEEAIESVIENAFLRKNTYVCFTNVHMLTEAKDDENFANVVNSATFAYADGLPIVKLMRLFHGIEQERIAGMDFTPALLKKSEEKGLIVSVYGNTISVLNNFKAYVEAHYPKLIIGALISPPFRKLETDEELYYIQELNKANSNIILVSLGCPKQEKWMYKNSKLLNGVCLGIGNAINTTIGIEKRPSLFIQKLGLEWFYRLIQNPRRLFKRYLLGNSKFLIIAVQEYFLIKFRRFF